MSPAVEAAKAYVQDQPVLHSEETSYPPGNRDGGNLQGTQGCLWVPSVVRIPLGRNYRLLCHISGPALQPYAVLSHEAYNKYARGTRR